MLKNVTGMTYYHASGQVQLSTIISQKNYNVFIICVSDIQGVTEPHRQNDRDDRPCREDHFFMKEHVLANMSFMGYAQVKVFARKGRN